MDAIAEAAYCLHGPARGEFGWALVARCCPAARLCGTCMDARGIQENDLIEDAKRSSMDELAQATLLADKVIAL